jgi:hypothetical protein
MKGLIFFGVAVLGASAQAFVVDDFMTGSYNSGAISSGTVDSWVNASSALGTIRYQSLSVTANPLLGDAKCRVITTPGVLDVSSDADVDINYTLGYGFANTSAVPASSPLNFDMTSNFLVNMNVRTNDLLLPVTVTLYTNGGANSFTRSLNVAAGINSASPVTYQFDFSSDAASLGDVDGIKFYFDPTAGGDFSLNNIQTVPEPMSIAVLSVGALALLRRRKK